MPIPQGQLASFPAAEPHTPAQHLLFDGPQPEMDAAGVWAYDDSTDLERNPRFRRIPHFHSAYLPTDRDISVWLPPTYGTEPDRRFPVLFLHDGQNLFDPHTSYVPGRTWCAHSTADRLAREQLIEPVILVGVANAGHHRMEEYTPSRDWRHGGGKSPLYARLLVDELKPLIDASLRTRPGPANTGLAGSSLGGLVSLAIGLDYPHVFGKLGVLSPSVWWNRRDILTRIGPPDESSSRPRIPPPFRRLFHPTPAAPRSRPAPDSPRPRIWLDMGTHEGLRHVRDCDLLHQRLLDRGWEDDVDLRYLRVPGGVHDEDAWARRFHHVLQWLFPPSAPDTTAIPASATQQPR